MNSLIYYLNIDLFPTVMFLIKLDVFAFKWYVRGSLKYKLNKVLEISFSTSVINLV